jgi:hypothetical protein
MRAIETILLPESLCCGHARQRDTVTCGELSGRSWEAVGHGGFGSSVTPCVHLVPNLTKGRL